MWLQTLKTLAEQAAPDSGHLGQHVHPLYHLLSYPAPASDPGFQTSPPYRDQWENPLLALGHRDSVWYCNLKPDRTPGWVSSLFRAKAISLPPLSHMPPQCKQTTGWVSQMCLIGKVLIKLGPQWGKKALIRALLTGASWQNFEKGNQSKKAWTVFKKSTKTHEDLSEWEKIYQGFIILMQISRPLTILEWWIWLSGQMPRISGETCKKLDSTSGMTFSQLVDVAFKVFNREQQQKKRRCKAKCHLFGTGFLEGKCLEDR